MSDFADLLERVEKLEGPSTNMDISLMRLVDPDAIPYSSAHLRYTASIDAAIGLVERMMPRHSLFLAITADKDELPCACDIANGTRDPWTASARTPPLAILAALLRALIEKAAP